MSVSVSRTRLPPEQRRAQLLHCAIAAFAEHGVARATHAHVAERSGVSVPAVHSYFRSRDDLVAAVLEEVERRLMVIVSDPAIDRAGPREALTLMVRGFDRAAREEPDVIKVWLDWSTGFRADVWQHCLDMQEKIHRIVQGVLARGQERGLLSPGLDTQAAARLFVGGGHTVALLRFAGGKADEIETLIGHLIASIMGIGISPPAG